MEQLSCLLGCLVYLLGYSSPEVRNLGYGYSWKQAMEECGSKGGNLPEVKLLANDFRQINDIQHKNICIWLKATYRRADNLTDDKYPNSCCEIVFRDKTEGTAIKECVRCNVNNPYICASGNNTIDNQHKGDGRWWNADQYCNTHARGLPSDTNTEFLKHLQYDPVMWVNGVRTLDTNPTKGDGLFPVCSCKELVSLTCPSNVWTYCVLESMNTERFWTSYVTSPLSASLNLLHTSTSKLEDASSLEGATTIRENGALIGGVVGAGVVLTIIIIIIVVVFVLRRSKQNRNRNSNSQGAVNHDNVNDAYDNINGEVTYSDKHTYIQIQHLERGSIIYATPSNVEGGQQDKRSENAHSDKENASPDQISENIYVNADCHRRLQDGSSGYL